MKQQVRVKRISLEEQVRATALIKRMVNERSAGKVLYITISGSDLYGFPSENSDVDYRGCYQTHTNNLLGLKGYREVIDAREPDISMFELRKEITLAMSSNCNVLEHLNAPTVYRTAESMELKELMNNCITKNGLHGSYKGLALHNYEKFISKGLNKTYKKYLYIFRGLMAGTYALQTGRIQPNMNELNKYFKLKPIKELIKMKQDGVEQEIADDMMFSGELDELILPMIDKLDEAYEKSRIPKRLEDSDKDKVNSWLITLRRGFMA